MKKVAVLVLFCSIGRMLGMHQTFSVEQVREMLADCKKFEQAIPFFDAEFVQKNSLQDMQNLMTRLAAGVHCCQEMATHLDADGWPKAVRKIVDSHDRLEYAMRLLTDYMAYKSDPDNFPLPVQRKRRTPHLDDE